MFAAPIRDLRTALQAGSLKTLNPFPWPFMTGNCLGWVVYAHYTNDPFVLAANVPGLVLSLWLNMGAAKLQYAERMRHRTAESRNHVSDDTIVQASECENEMILVPIERNFLRIVIVWACTIVVMQWMGGWKLAAPATVIGLLVNLNLVVFYSAPLQSLQTVLLTKRSDSIHRPTLFMNYVNTSFWILYGGFVRNDPMIYVPNGLGLTLGLIQGILCVRYPSGGEVGITSRGSVEDPHEPILIGRRSSVAVGDDEDGRMNDADVRDDE
ncbi:hypothetical protein FisN_3Hh363 [Fistulifera solaris]|uniref:Bidirectional sugar transporter SWEET n=1 Tax=Fistulifera solaris TaxID=1519565 RepID=A0A1Z5JQI2_FISSO|nr:hypothetical protein FisN_3Hh363 [Fistulifera solaris]|eukprot:GAX16156.1 hypothetical protein FisN_3Hh363 [Fistulifera solaris]